MRESSDFRTTIARGSRAGSATVVVHLRQNANPPAPPARVGFVVSKSVGNAVVRNRVKRVLRHLTAAQLDGLTEGSLAVVRALPASAGATTAQLDADLRSALSRAHAKPSRHPRAKGRRSD